MVLLGNMAAFLPLGILLPLAQPRVAFLGLVLAAVGLSVAIETAQLVISLVIGLDYRTADIDDVILNVCGSAIGYFSAWRPGPWISGPGRERPLHLGDTLSVA